MAANQKNQTRISSLAKDLGMRNKDILDLLAENGIEGKSHSATLNEDEFNLVMNELTSRNQMSGIGDYLDKKITIDPPKPAAKPKAEKPKAEPKAEPKPEPKAGVKAEPKPEEKPEPKPETAVKPEKDAEKPKSGEKTAETTKTETKTTPEKQEEENPEEEIK